MTQRVLVTDLDNTLWDWFAAWHGSFTAMLQELIRQTGIPQTRLEQEMRVVHRRHGTTEYTHLLDELPSLREAAGSIEPWRAFPGAIDALRSERRRLTKLYPGVLETLNTLRRAGYRIVGYTESLAYWTEWRIRRTELDGIIDVLYSAPDHDHPRDQSLHGIRSRPDDFYGLKNTTHNHVPRGVLKPNAEVLLEILRGVGAAPQDAYYIGDSLMKDIAMAQSANVTDIHAAYGESQRSADYELLRAVTHWTDEDVAREKEITAQAGLVVPTHVCQNRFSELLAFLPLD
ncbi:haloacid dehalogenase [Tessaracoccus lapidicaptus]|uniref:Haloacid dehalogenase n=1 Tax=Tessaracoccus lapidicaptus TaxID=1427523 RepID=A0A1C0AQX7_9ACTN|nr:MULTISPECIES: HAD hydrolase-like protein [Tessaracoccus]AQX14871.1 haloacid dehalogenase [Tessaracoccus sp. T2.5-30]OCL36690.1 haloacid dehalogenase [Tessaracoccus lapidicaptus]VEP38999.1 Phosphoglycolate phosphatase [Tessaracoccus lapidicaptus]